MRKAFVLLLGLALLIAIGRFLDNDVLGRPVVRQPIEVNHLKHLEEKVECRSCHPYARNYDAAGLPGAKRCWSCHQKGITKSPEAQKIKAYAETGKEIPWVRLSKLADHVAFSHAIHIRTGSECRDCHGDIGRSPKADPRANLGGLSGRRLMEDFCLSCHRKQNAETDCMGCHT